eukprot:6157133-Pyramimonas_sp.AAC.2
MNEYQCIGGAHVPARNGGSGRAMTVRAAPLPSTVQVGTTRLEMVYPTIQASFFLFLNKGPTLSLIHI